MGTVSRFLFVQYSFQKYLVKLFDEKEEDYVLF